MSQSSFSKTSASAGNFTSTAVPYGNTDGTLTQDSTNYVYTTANGLRVGPTSSGITTENKLSVIGNANDYHGTMVQNLSAGASASTDMIVANDSGGASDYADFGVNSSGNTNSSFTLFGTGDCYLFTSGAVNNLNITTGTAGKIIKFGTGGTLSANERMRLADTGLSIKTTATPTAFLHLGASTTGSASQRIAAGTAPTSPNNGDIWNDSTQNMIAFYNGNTLFQAGNLYTATAAVTNATTTPTTAFSSTKIGTTTIAASSLKVGQKFAIWGAGYYSTPIGNTSTVTITVKIGSTTVSTVTTGALPSSATNLPFDFNLQFTIRATGASATLVCDGTFNYATALSAVAKTSNSLSTIGTITFDSTASQALDVLASWSAVTTQTATIQQSKIDFL